MCGIAGAIGNFAPGEAEPIVKSMASSLAHRGPDDCGIGCWTFGGNTVAFGHTRLSILDLSSAGHQPMTEQSGRYWTTFNGEIYNFQELRKLLDPARERFRTSTDTEVILHAYDRWSERAFSALRGMFAFALLDRTAGVVHLVRDPLGIKPLYYCEINGKLLFASELRTLLASGLIDRKIDSAAIDHFLKFGWVRRPASTIAGIKPLEPGRILTVDLAREKLTYKISTFETAFPEPNDFADSDQNECVAHLRHLLLESVKCHLVSDVPVGLFLSGGIDSTALLHLMHESGAAAPKTFTVVFQEKGFSESAYAKKVAERYSTDHHELELSEAQLLHQLPSALAAMDQPTMDGVNTFAIARAISAAGIKVALSGLGSDELFAGYPSFHRARWARLARRIPAPVRETVAFGGRCLVNYRYGKVWDLLESDCAPESVYRVSRQLFSPEEMAILRPGTAPVKPSSDSLSVQDDVNCISRLEIDGYMTGLLLRDTDFMSMASSLEVRVPFVDKFVVRHALRMPGRWKVARSSPKPLLLDSMRGNVPGYVWNRRKMGFAFPLDRWMRSSFRSQVEATLNDSRLAHAAGLSPEGCQQMWGAFLDGAVRWSKPWSLFVLMKWCERHRAFA